MYGKSFEKTEEIMHLDFLLPIGKAKIKREGKNDTIVNFSKRVGNALERRRFWLKMGLVWK